MAGFSSRGPDDTSNGDLVKPDIAAPGVGILAAVSPEQNGGANFAMESGTSMATPHIAGLAALIRGAHPDWSPMEVKSAMMTTAYDTKTDRGGDNTDPFAQGAGFVNPRRFLEPGLLYDSNSTDWLAYLKGTGATTDSPVTAIDPSDLNLPSIGIGRLVGSQTVTRTVTSTGAGTYAAKVSLPGFDARVSPSTLSFTGAGQKASFKVTLTRTTAKLNHYATGFLTWTADREGGTVRSPIAVQPVPLEAPAQVRTAATGTSGSTSYKVTPGKNGPIGLKVTGPVPGQVHNGTVAVGEANPTTRGDAANKVFKFKVPAGASAVRIDLVAPKAGQGVDLYLLDSLGHQYDGSLTPGPGGEILDMGNPAEGTYYLVVNGESNTGSGPVSFSLRTFTFNGTQGKLTASPDPIPGKQADPATVTLKWSGLKPSTPYFGFVRYSTSSKPTAVNIG
ncbi:hypothetical protein GCM10022403_052900 [Streptomyces coacervatus]|uniref:S8 family serine peptidase n=1 Tax=Streptomyces coacervatus TaxID=647381 RepID=A0ABP7I937_9ACTN|nr:S8 family serine peptidase [Streptomyces coacervatus]MDF2272768.1 S8 family serine peptidase [Streptomyces coacervatus]